MSAEYRFKLEICLYTQNSKLITIFIYKNLANKEIDTVWSFISKDHIIVGLQAGRLSMQAPFFLILILMTGVWWHPASSWSPHLVSRRRGVGLVVHCGPWSWVDAGLHTSAGSHSWSRLEERAGGLVGIWGKVGGGGGRKGGGGGHAMINVFQSCEPILWRNLAIKSPCLFVWLCVSTKLTSKCCFYT